MTRLAPLSATSTFYCKWPSILYVSRGKTLTYGTLELELLS